MFQSGRLEATHDLRLGFVGQGFHGLQFGNQDALHQQVGQVVADERAIFVIDLDRVLLLCVAKVCKSSSAPWHRGKDPANRAIGVGGAGMADGRNVPTYGPRIRHRVKVHTGFRSDRQRHSETPATVISRG